MLIYMYLFSKYSKHTATVLAEMSWEDAVTTADYNSKGIVLDSTQSIRLFMEVSFQIHSLQGKLYFNLFCE
jgi:hypothetical protein